MKKRKKAAGAPSHIQLFSTMMILLLAFFIVLVSLIDKTIDSGFEDNIGDIQDAFGVKGGIGMLRYHFTRDSRSPITLQEGREGLQSDALEMTSVVLRGSGGVGTNETEPEERAPRLLQVPIPHRFAAGEALPTPEMKALLDIAGTVLALSPSYQVTLRQTTCESGEWAADMALAHRRAIAVMTYLRRSCGLPPGRLTAVGQAAWPVDAAATTESQALVIELFRPKGA